MRKSARTTAVLFTYFVAALMLLMVLVEGFMVAGSALAVFLGMASFGMLIGVILNVIALFTGVTIKVAFWVASMISKSLDLFLRSMFPEPVAAEAA